MTTATDIEFRGKRGNIVARRWDPQDAPTFVVLLSHGYGEHTGRYGHVAARLNDDGAVVYAPDHYGHGRSAGDQAVVFSVDDMATDLASLREIAREEHPDLPLIVLGHSLGGLIATRFVQTQTPPVALVLSGPLLGVDAATLALAEMDPIPEVPVDPDTLSRDPAVGEAYAGDPLVYHGGFARETLQGIGAAIGQVAADKGFGTLPTLWIHGEADALVPYEPVRAAMEHLRGPATEEKVYPEAKHEIFNETNQDEVLDDVIAFVNRALESREG